MSVVFPQITWSKVNGMRALVTRESMKGYTTPAWSYTGKICKEKISVWGYTAAVSNNNIFASLLRILVLWAGCDPYFFFSPWTWCSFFELNQLQLNHQVDTRVCFGNLRDSQASLQTEVSKRKGLESAVQSCETLASNLNWNQTIPCE